MTVPLAVLIVEDSESDTKLVVRLLEKAGYKVLYKQVETAGQMQLALEKQAWDLVISDYSLPHFDGSAALDLLQKTGLDIPFIVVSGTMGEETAVGMMKAGAHDYLVKGKLARLAPAVERELAQAEERRAHRQAEEELHRSRELLNQSFASLHDAIFIIEEGTHKILDCNPAACQMFGYDRTEILGQDTALLHVNKVTLTDFRKRLRLEVQESGFFYLSEYQMRRRDGSLFFTDQTVSPLRDGDDHKITGWVSTIRDITESKQAEEALRKSEQVLREAESLGHTGSWEQDLVTGKIFNTGENLRLFFGDDPDKGEPFEDYAQAVHPDDREFVLQRRTQLLEGGPGDIEYRVVWPDGSVHVIFGRATVVRNELGQAIRVYGTNVDITERKQAEDALRESESILRGFLEQSTDAIMLADEKGIVIQWSKGAEKLTGYSREESIGKSIWDVQFRSAPDEFKSPEFYERMKAGMQAVLLEGQGNILNRFLEATIQRRDGTRSITQTLAFSIRTHKGFQIGSILRDITESKTAEEKLRLSDQILQRVFALVIVCDSQANIIYVSPAAKTILGYEPDELLGDEWWKVSRSDLKEAEGEKEYVRRAARGEIPIAAEVYERPIQDRWGNTHWISWVDAAGPDGLLIGVGHDITEHKQAEATIKISEERFRTLYENNTIGLYRTTPDGHILLANPALVKMLGYSSFEELSAINLEQEGLGVTYSRSQFLELIERHGEVQGLEAAWERKDGKTIFIRESARALRDPQGKTLYYDGTIEDITERKRAEEAVQESETRYRSLFEDSPISLWEQDFSAIKQRLDNLREAGITNFEEYFSSHPEAVTECAALIKVVDVNKATLKMFGADRKEILFNNLPKIFEGEPIELLQDEFIKIAEGRTRFDWEGLNKTLNGRLINVDLSWSVAPGFENSLSKVIVSVIDITESKKAEAALQESEDRFRSLFEDSPISLWEEDFSAVQQRLDNLRKTGIKDFEEYLNSHPEVVTECAALVKVVDVNKATLKMFGADRKEDIKSLIEIFDGSPSHAFRNELITIAAGNTSFKWEGSNRTLDGRQLDIDLSWLAAPGYERSLSKVIVSKIDITERKRAEDEIRVLAKFPDENPFPVLRLNAKGVILYANNASRAILEEWKATIGQEAPAFWLKKVTEVLKNQSKQEIDISAGDKIFSFVIAPIIEAGYVNLYGLDITDRKRAEAALARSEKDYRTLFENMPIGQYRTSADGRILDANQALIKMFGYKDRQALLAANIVELYVDPASDEKFKNEIEKKDIVTNFEAEFRRPDGTTFWTADHNRLFRDQEGNPLYYEGSLIDITERKEAEKRIQRQLEHLAALRSIDQVVISSFDLRISLTMILNQAARELGVDAADVLLLNSTNLYLEYTAGVGFRTKAAEKASVRLGQSFAGRVALDRQLIQIPDLKDRPEDMHSNAQWEGEGFVCYFGVPLVAKGVVRGVLEVYHRAPLEPDQEWLDFMNTLADQAALAIDNANMFDNLQRSNIDLTLAYDATIEGWSRAMDLRDKETEGHTLRVTEMTMELAGLFGIKDEELVGIRRGALLHDIGKMGVPDAILLKPSMLTDEEWVSMKKHPTFAFEMLSPIHYLKSAIDIPYCHHEKWDGTGYPRGLKGEQIPLPARIFAIVDVWDAVTSDRPYRKAWSKEKAIEHLKSQAGSQFDPKIVQVCLEAGVFDRKDWSHPTGHD